MLKNNLPNPSLEEVGWRAGGPSASRDRRRWVCCGSAMSWRGVACDALFIEANIILCRVLAKLPGGASASPPSFFASLSHRLRDTLSLAVAGKRHQTLTP